MRASPRATPMTIPATVPLASRCDGTGAPEVADLVGWLLVEVLELVLGLPLGLMLLGEERTVVGISLVGDTGLGAAGVTEGLGTAPTGGLEVVDVEELVELLPTLEDVGIEAEVVLDTSSPEAVGDKRPPVSVVVGSIPGKYNRVRVSTGTPIEDIMVKVGSALFAIFAILQRFLGPGQRR